MATLPPQETTLKSPLYCAPFGYHGYLINSPLSSLSPPPPRGLFINPSGSAPLLLFSPVSPPPTTLLPPSFLPLGPSQLIFPPAFYSPTPPRGGWTALLIQPFGSASLSAAPTAIGLFILTILRERILEESQRIPAMEFTGDLLQSLKGHTRRCHGNLPPDDVTTRGLITPMGFFRILWDSLRFFFD